MKEDIEKLKQAGSIAKETVAYARSITKKGMPLLKIAEDIEEFIRKKGAQPAFPVNLSINEIAAHATPIYNDEQTAHGLLKIDIGVHLDGWAADTALSLDLENNQENQNLIDAAEAGLKAALKITKLNLSLSKLGGAIEQAIKEKKVQPIINLSGHSIEHYNLHAGFSIPNIETPTNEILEEGIYAIEPFTTTGSGTVKEGKPSTIYHLQAENAVRDPFARELLTYIQKTYNTLPL